MGTLFRRVIAGNASKSGSRRR